MGRRGTILLLAIAVALGSASLLAACSSSGKLTVSALEPSRGPHYGGDPVTIVGTGFNKAPKGVKIYFGKKSAKPPVIISDTQMRVEPPGGEINEEVEVEVVFDDSRSAKVPGKYKYVDPNAK